MGCIYFPEHESSGKGGLMPLGHKPLGVTAAERVWLRGFKVQATPQNLQVLDQVLDWTAIRARPKHVMQAIRLYGGLLRGDTSVLFELFPWVAALSGTHQLPTPKFDIPVIAYVERSDAENVTDFSTSFGDIEF